MVNDEYGSDDANEDIERHGKLGPTRDATNVAVIKVLMDDNGNDTIVAEEFRSDLLGGHAGSGTDAPSAAPSAAPSDAPSAAPSAAPSTAPSAAPSTTPSAASSAAPSVTISVAPSITSSSDVDSSDNGASEEGGYLEEDAAAPFAAVITQPEEPAEEVPTEPSPDGATRDGAAAEATGGDDGGRADTPEIVALRPPMARATDEDAGQGGSSMPLILGSTLGSLLCLVVGLAGRRKLREESDEDAVANEIEV